MPGKCVEPDQPDTSDNAALVQLIDEHRQRLSHTRFAAGYAGGDFAGWQQRARVTLARLVGFDAEQHVTHPPALAGELLWQREHPLGRIQKWRLRADGRADVPVYWCMPGGRSAPLPAMICLQGHTPGMHCSIGVSQGDPFVDEPVAGDRDFALQCLARGVAALCVEQRGFGERRENTQRTTDCQHMAVRALLLGGTLLGERVADVHLACRWLAQQREVDAGRIGVMGNSAGGTTALYAAALLPGIRLVVPSCSFGPLRDTWFAGSRCVCGYVPNMLNVLDLPDVLALHAPRPVVVVGGEGDYHCPPGALRQAFAELQQRYAAAGAAEACRLVIGAEGHRFYAELAWPAMVEAL